MRLVLLSLHFTALHFTYAPSLRCITLHTRHCLPSLRPFASLPSFLFARSLTSPHVSLLVRLCCIQKKRTYREESHCWPETPRAIPRLEANVDCIQSFSTGCRAQVRPRFQPGRGLFTPAGSLCPTMVRTLNRPFMCTFVCACCVGPVSASFYVTQVDSRVRWCKTKLAMVRAQASLPQSYHQLRNTIPFVRLASRFWHHQ